MGKILKSSSTCSVSHSLLPQCERPELTGSHYDVEIDPVVKVANQKKPKALLRAVWEQLVLEQKDPKWVNSFSASAFDGRKNAYTPNEFPLDRGEFLPPLILHQLSIRGSCNQLTL